MHPYPTIRQPLYMMNHGSQTTSLGSHKKTDKKGNALQRKSQSFDNRTYIGKGAEKLKTLVFPQRIYSTTEFFYGQPKGGPLNRWRRDYCAEQNIPAIDKSSLLAKTCPWKSKDTDSLGAKLEYHENGANSQVTAVGEKVNSTTADKATQRYRVGLTSK